MISIIVIRLIALILISAYILTVKRSRSISSVTWEELIARLNPVRMHDLTELAAERLSGGPSGSTFKQKYQAIGGDEGIRRIKQNAKTLIVLAAYAETWRPGVSADVVRRMRADGFKLQRAAWQISFLSFALNANLLSSRLLRDLSKIYCGMTDQLLHLYSIAHAAKRPQLLAACGYW